MRHPRGWFALALACALLPACGRDAPEPAAAPRLILTDGRFDEWASIPPITTGDAPGMDPLPIDLGGVAVADDPAFVHLAVDVGRPANAQTFAGTMIIAFDADHDIDTGGPAVGVRGVDVVAELSVREAGAALGAGTGIRLVGADGPGPVRPSYDLGLLVSPTHAAARWEIRIRRGTAFGGRRLFAGPTLRFAVAVVDDHGLRERTPMVTYALASTVLDAAAGPAVDVPAVNTPAVSIPAVDVSGQQLAASPGTVRVVSWNVGGERLRDHPGPFLRVLAALDPDVLLLDELFESVTSETLDALLAAPQLAARGPYEVVLGTTGGRQHAAVASRVGIAAEPRLLDIRYPAGSLDAWARASGDGPSVAALAAAEAARGLSVAGAWVGPPERTLLAVAIDLHSGGHAGSPGDTLRELQAELLATRLRSLAPTALVIGGDLNLVGSDRPLDALRTRAQGAGALQVADAYRLSDRSQATWRAVRRARAFGPGRLDFQLVTPATLAIDRAFVLHTGELSETARRALGLRATDTDEASQHLPVVVDYRFSR